MTTASSKSGTGALVGAASKVFVEPGMVKSKVARGPRRLLTRGQESVEAVRHQTAASHIFFKLFRHRRSQQLELTLAAA